MKKMQMTEIMSPMSRMMIQIQSPKLVLKKKSVQKNSNTVTNCLSNSGPHWPSSLSGTMVNALPSGRSTLQTDSFWQQLIDPMGTSFTATAHLVDWQAFSLRLLFKVDSNLEQLVTKWILVGLSTGTPNIISQTSSAFSRDPWVVSHMSSSFLPVVCLTSTSINGAGVWT